MALLQQAAQCWRVVVAAVDQAFVERLQLVAQVTDRANRGHARTALEGMQIALQRGQRQGVVRLAEPALQRLTGTLQNVHRLFEEDLHHFFVEFGIGRARVVFDLHFSLRRFDRVLDERRLGNLLILARQLAIGLLQLDHGLIELDDVQPIGARRQQGQGIGIDGFAEQVAQRLHSLGLRADLQGGGDLIHHADQRFVGFFRLVEEALADGQAAFFDGTVKVQQGLAQLVDLRQLGHLGTTAKGGQFFQ